MAFSKNFHIKLEKVSFFKPWQKKDLVKSEYLVTAGFWFQDNNDNVRCLQCGVVVGNIPQVQGRIGPIRA